MNPIKELFLSLSRMPPALMLLIIIGLAILVTMMVTGRVSEQEAQLAANAKGASVYTRASGAGLSDASSDNLERGGPGSAYGGLRSAASTMAGPRKEVVISRTYIPAGVKIEEKFLSTAELNELELWDDAATSKDTVLGRVSRRPIPANNQIREMDLN